MTLPVNSTDVTTISSRISSCTDSETSVGDADSPTAEDGESARLSQSGPRSHRRDSTRSSANIPRVSMSAGLSDELQ